MFYVTKFIKLIAKHFHNFESYNLKVKYFKSEVILFDFFTNQQYYLNNNTFHMIASFLVFYLIIQILICIVFFILFFYLYLIQFHQ